MARATRGETPVITGPAVDGHGVVLQAVDLAKTYYMGEVEVHALRGVDLSLYGGEFMVLLGPSGSGKSTLLNILGGLDVPTRGRVYYHGGELTTAREAVISIRTSETPCNRRSAPSTSRAHEGQSIPSTGSSTTAFWEPDIFTSSP